MKQVWIVVLLLGFMGQAQAVEDRVYLVALANLGGSNLAQVVFLHEPQITQLEGCEEARLQGIRERDWSRYHHIFMSHRMKGYTVQMQYRCVTSEQSIDGWYDKARYDYAYLVEIEATARMRLRQSASLAQCGTALQALPVAKRQQSYCAMANQKLLAVP
ncbi:hypothetical protein OU997_16620 [Pseudomonas sp. SL4(2022)]|uniref:hypothetical protein n=1 Tax=Pseudomonas sp. SL4(2022) TaxID=2994661 RepID=UPI00226FE925|nr:hypothetical protein [Pseudomonas sp. SL4(2022)]WAC43855.1 hypothetical protein OU997_16620 [Pseudomonas sp. SL4(2022)]